jgi:hypothetical protein
MRSSPSGRQIPNEVLRYTFPLVTGDAGSQKAPLPYCQAVLSTDPFLPTLSALPGELGLGAVQVLSGGGNTGDKISCQWLLITLNGLVPVITPTGKPFLIDPTVPGGVSHFQIDSSDVIIPDTGAGLVLAVTIPANLVVTSALLIGVSVGAFWKDSALRNALI